MPRDKIKVIKVPLADTPKHRPQSFEQMPRMYLELIENKNKIKQNLVNQEYSPSKSEPISFESKKSSSRDNDSIGKLDIDLSSLDSESDDENEGDVSSKLQELLRADNISETNETKKSPPTLAELGERGEYKQNKTHIPNIEKLGDDYEEDEEDKKRELLFKFQLLKKSYKDADIPEFSIHSDYNQMNRTYENTVRRLSLDSTVDTYKTYLIGGFMLTEFILGSWMKFDMEGFTQQQIRSMGSYDRLLIELGEKSYVPEGSDWPVELRLLFLIIINAGFFCVSKMLMKKTGSNILNMINSMNTNNSGNSNPLRRKKRMKEPSINLDEIPDLSDML